MTRCTGCGRYVLARRSSLIPANHSSMPYDSTCARVAHPRRVRPDWLSPGGMHAQECPRNKSCLTAGRSGGQALLRFAVQLPLKHPDLYWCFQAHRQSPLLSFFESTQNQGSFPLPALPGFAGTTTLSEAHTGRRPSTTLEVRPSPVPGLPQLPGSPSLHAVLITPADRTGADRFLPYPHGLPCFRDRSASATSLSRPAQASLTLRPAELLTHHSWALSRGFDSAS